MEETTVTMIRRVGEGLFSYYNLSINFVYYADGGVNRLQDISDHRTYEEAIEYRDMTLNYMMELTDLGMHNHAQINAS